MKNKPNDSGLQFIIPNEKQRNQWDALVQHSANGNIYSLSWYLDAVANGNWGLVTDESISCGLPVAFKRRTGYKNIYQPFYTMFFDVVGDAKNIQPFIDKIANDYHHIHITTQNKTGYLRHKDRLRQEMVLEKEFEKGYSENTRRQIKKAEKSELKFDLHTSAAEVVRLFRENKGKELREYKPADFTRLKNLIEAALVHKNAFCAHVTSEKSVLASAVFLTFQNRIVFLKGGVNAEGKEKGAMYFLMHKAIEHALITAIHDHQRYKKNLIFDFGGSNNKNVAKFYRKFGGRDIGYYEIELDKRNIIQKALSKFRR
ncbi:MAG TPA: GNAT family N-acetyltransferase [Flavobacteriales bacterium]|nr:GNAT family N-acetyltransferase [Flavobacteriales bacterium]